MRAALLGAARMQRHSWQQPRRTARQQTRGPWQGLGFPVGAATAPPRLSRRQPRLGARCGQLLRGVLTQQRPLQQPVRSLLQARTCLCALH